ncbi:MAG: hypothetical protein Q4G13_04660 [Moraxella sp.]|nr:hypothetical protein [Moraxella sp.]
MLSDDINYEDALSMSSKVCRIWQDKIIREKLDSFGVAKVFETSYDEVFLGIVKDDSIEAW